MLSLGVATDSPRARSPARQSDDYIGGTGNALVEGASPMNILEGKSDGDETDSLMLLA